jgi:hypothetical protein
MALEHDLLISFGQNNNPSSMNTGSDYYLDRTTGQDHEKTGDFRVLQINGEFLRTTK